MKILFVIAHLGKGGGQQTQAIRLINEIGKHHESTLVTLNYPSSIVEPPGKTKYVGALRFPRGMLDIKRYLKQNADDFDIIHALDPYYALPAVWLSKKRPFVVRLGINPVLDLKYRKKHLYAFINSFLLPRMLKASSGVIVNSKHFLDEFAKFKPIFIPNGYDFQSLLTDLNKDECRERLGFPKDKFILLYTGKVIPRKNLEVVLDIINDLDNAYFTIVGNTNEPLYGDKYYRKLCIDYKETMNKVIFTGELPMGEIKYVLKACDAYVFPSLLEGSPNSVLEAMVAGLPVICSNIDSHKKIIDNGKTGMLFKGKNELLKCIKAIINDGNLAQKVGISGHKYVKKNHDIADVADKYTTLYQNILSRKC
jgi:glycosyltransferase involved in cell wall biosynthesis